MDLGGITIEENEEELLEEEREEPVKKHGETQPSSKIPVILVLALLLGAIAGALAGLAVQSLMEDEDDDLPFTVVDNNIGIQTTTPDSELDVDGVITVEGGNSGQWNTAYGWGDHSTAGYMMGYTETDPVYGASAASGITSGDMNNWDTAFGWGDHSVEGYLTSTSETDPVYGSSVASGITTGDMTNWDAAYGWGDHSTEGYLTGYSETDPVYGTSVASGITGGNITDWDTAYSWGDHTTEGYLTGESDPVYGVSVASGITSGDVTNWDMSFNWGDHSLAGYLLSESDPQVGVNTLNYTSRWNGNELVAGSIFDNGNIGIGTSSPGVKLDVETFFGDGGTATFGSSGNSATGDYAIAFGDSTTASGMASISMGWNTEAKGFLSVATGGWTVAYGPTSIAMGYQTNASGESSLAMGDSTEALGDYSTAMGFTTNAVGDYSTAMGYLTTASGLGSTTMGSATDATANYAIAMGISTTASGAASTAMGWDSIASGSTSTSMGYMTVASGDISTSMGSNTNAIGLVSTAMGSNTTASGNYSTAIGHSINARGNYSVGIGLDSTPRTITQNNTMAIMGGNVGIGITSPIAPLMVVGDGDTIRVNGDSNPGGIHIAPTPFANGWWIGTGTGAPSQFIIRDAVQSLDRIVITTNGNVGIGESSPSSKLHVNGEVRAQSYRDSTNPAFFVDPGAPWSGEFAGDFGIGSSSPSDDDDIGFDQMAEYLRWDDGADYFTFSNDLYLSDSLDVDGHVYLGDAGADNIVATGRFASSIIPSSSNMYDLGDGTRNWRDVYASRYRDGENPSYFLDAANTGTSLAVAGSVAIGSPAPNGALDIQSTTGALIVPRMTTTQRNGLPLQNGSIIYNTTTGQFEFCEAGAWVVK